MELIHRGARERNTYRTTSAKSTGFFVEAALSNRVLHKQEVGHTIAPAPVRHCLMCHADTTLEVEDEAVGVLTVSESDTNVWTGLD